MRRATTDVLASVKLVMLNACCAGSAQGAQDDLIRVANYAVKSLSAGAKTVPAGEYLLNGIACSTQAPLTRCTNSRHCHPFKDSP